jgi:hypothetical protein
MLTFPAVEVHITPGVVERCNDKTSDVASEQMKHVSAPRTVSQILRGYLFGEAGRKANPRQPTLSHTAGGSNKSVSENVWDVRIIAGFFGISGETKDLATASALLSLCATHTRAT